MSFNVLILGATGLCGSAILKFAAKEPSFATILTITRREIKDSYDASKVKNVIAKSSDSWADLIPKDVNIMFSGLATTMGEAGKDNFYKVDHDLNVELAKRAKSQGCSTYVLVSSVGANENSSFYYMKTKGEIERDILALNFDKTIILRPGPLIGQRDKDKGFMNGLSAKLGQLLYKTRLQRLLSYPASGEDVAKAGVKLAVDHSRTSKIQIIESKEILELASEAA
ncbi:LANO_0G18404g1_1 [Lachancea nothofagi CBS 11611]|uniref:Protein FMP52, mitochondrial n=1 Tax=Lachancea nothofagi CBS 11611 TaxID=1266666 RepID=A0A1G4KKU5_9SACH|nr:LANO_0G18404g1_1 [Lachancea nothofagi CBS 11611]